MSEGHQYLFVAILYPSPEVGNSSEDREMHLFAWLSIGSVERLADIEYSYCIGSVIAEAAVLLTSALHNDGQSQSKLDSLLRSDSRAR